jgi:hypothetical protein
MLKGFKKSGLQSFFVTLCLCTFYGYGDTWNPDPAIAIPNSSASSSPSVFSSCNSSGDFLATWLDQTSGIPTYSIYTSSWGIPISLGSTDGDSSSMVFSAFDSSTGNYLITWRNGTSTTPNNGPFYSLYSGGVWTSPAPIAGISSAITSNVYCSSDSNGHFLATWCPNSGGLPFFAIYTEGSSGSWGGSFSIPSGAAGDVVSSYDSSTETFLVTWASGGSGQYSLVNLTPSPQWTFPSQIPSAETLSNVFSSSDSQGNFLLTWTDKNNNTATYSIYDSTNDNWSTPVSIASSATNGDVTSSFDSSTGNFLITWKDTGTNTPYYSIYNPSASPEYTAQSQVAPQGSITSASDIFSSCDQSSGTFLVTFADVNSIPSYTFYTESLPPPPPSPIQAAGNFQGKQKINNFAVVSERYNALSWELSSGAESYRLYRNGSLIATLGESITSYDDHNQPKTTQSYTLTAVGAGGSVASTTTSVGK